MKIALIPAYNAVHTIAELVLKVKEVVDLVVVFDDGSTDDTAYVAEKCGAKVIKSDRNRGKGFALRELFDAAKRYNPEVVVTLDADMQHNPYDIPKIIEPVLKGEADVVLGLRKKVGGIRKLGNLVLDKMGGQKETQCGFRAYSLSAMKYIKIASAGFAVDTEILAATKDLQVKEVLIDVECDEYSHTKNFILHFMEVFNFIFLRRPLRNLGILGAAMFFFGVIAIGDVVTTWRLYSELALGTFLAGITAIILGAFSFFTGIILHVLKERK